jgi:hypothetical protein
MSRIVKTQIIKNVSNTDTLSSGFQNLTINDSNVIQTTTAKCVLIGTVESDVGEIFAVNPESVIEEKVAYSLEVSDSWDNLMTDRFAAPIMIPKNKQFSVFGIYDSDYPYEYRIVLDDTQRDYYLGTGLESPYNNIRYVYKGYLDTYPNLFLADPNLFNFENSVSYIENLISNREILALNVDRDSAYFDNSDVYTTVEIYAVYGSGVGSRIPIEYRLVFDSDRREFYTSNSISEDSNYDILEAENTERITSDGLPIVKRSFYDSALM